MKKLLVAARFAILRCPRLGDAAISAAMIAGRNV